MSAAVCGVLRRHSVAVPEQVSFISFDDLIYPDRSDLKSKKDSYCTKNSAFRRLSAGIEIIEDLRDKTASEMLVMKGIGKKSIQAIEDELLYYGLGLKEE